MLKLRKLDLLELNALTCTGKSLGENLDAWEKSERRIRFHQILTEQDNVDPKEIIHSKEDAMNKGMTSTLCFPIGNLAPEGSVIKSTAIDPSVIDKDGVYRMTGPALVFTTERDAVRAVKGLGEKRVKPGNVIVLCGRALWGAWRKSPKLLWP